MTIAAYRKLSIGLIAVWFLTALSASALRAFQTEASRPPLALAFAALAPILLFWVWYAVSPGFREFALSLNPRVLTYAQMWRIGGLRFVLLYAYGMLAGMFALPAGLGDMAIGATALFAARWATPEHRRDFIFWQVLGITDLVMAVGLGTMSRLLNPLGPGADLMAVLPMSLVPTFFVPLLLIFHLICIAQARRWPARQHSVALPQAA